nr:uncharacterized protein LOC129387896 [Dermacentor andersoni]
MIQQRSWLRQLLLRHFVSSLRCHTTNVVQVAEFSCRHETQSGHSLLVRRLAPPELLLPAPPPPPAQVCSPGLDRRMSGLLSRLEQGFSLGEPTPGFYEALVEQLRASLAFGAVVPAAGSRARPSKAPKNGRQTAKDAL